MTHTYKITGMTCGGCEAKVKTNLLIVPGVTDVSVSKESQSATITMENHIPLTAFQNALDKKYTITVMEHNEAAEQVKGWLTTYKPILLIFAYVTMLATITSLKGEHFNLMTAMNTFMAGFFLSFSFFKMLDIKGFAESYAMYDIVAKKIKGWGFVYPFVELGLGIAYATRFDPVVTNTVTLIVMAISIIGVMQSVLNKRKIRCACLGAVFNLPMTTVTIIEDGLMIIMSAGMLIALR